MMMNNKIIHDTKAKEKEVVLKVAILDILCRLLMGEPKYITTDPITSMVSDIIESR